MGTLSMERIVYLSKGLGSTKSSIRVLEVANPALVAVDVLDEAVTEEVVGLLSQVLEQGIFFCSHPVLSYWGLLDKPAEGHCLRACITVGSRWRSVSFEGSYGEA